MAADMELFTLGPVRIFVAGPTGGTQTLGAQRAALLAYLALASPRGVVRRDTLLGLFWPERDAHHARGALRQALHELRALLGRDAIRVEGREGVGLDGARIRCDALELEWALDAGETERALSLYCGDFLEGVYVPGSVELEHWIEARRAHLRRRTLEACLGLTDELTGAGRLREAARRARQAMTLGPGDEAPLRRLIEVLLKLGDRAAAVEAFDRFSREISDIYGMAPTAETQALILAARQGETGQHAGAGPGTGTAGRVGAGWRMRAKWGIAVLPFTSLSPDPDNEFFADGITEDVITQLAKIQTLRVISRTSVMPFKGSDATLQQIGAKLGVATVVEGSVRRAGDRLRIVAQVIDVETGVHLWAETYDRGVTDIFAIQSEVALRIAAALEAEISPAESARIRKQPTTDLEAYHFYLKGRHSVFRYTPAGLARGIEFYRQAIRRDPDYGLAHAGLGKAYMIAAMGYDGGALTPAEAYDRARRAALRALEIDEELGEAHALLAWLEFQTEFAWDRAEQRFRRAIALSPGANVSHSAAGLMFSALQRWDEALAMQTRARDLDPLTAVHSSDIATTLLRAGRVEESAAEARAVLGVHPEFPMGHSILAWACILSGNFNAGLAELAQAVALAPDNAMLLAQLGQARAMAGQVQEARRTLRRLQRRARARFVSSYHLAYIHTGLHQRDKAVDCLEQAYAERAGGLYGVKGSFLFRSLHDHPRFIRLMEKMNLGKQG